ncbi:hypothetical protein [Desulfitobacterium sp. THU1]|uniref:hypothetical protein n=1 Tax=Desulfitobacterium sp. THU1 TaxID=3138072 RepID=UPI00311DC9AE
MIFLVFVLIIMSSGLHALWGQQWKDLGSATLALATLTVPFLINTLCNRVKLKLPPGFLFNGVVFIFLAQYQGEVKKFYQTFWWWDVFLHGAFGSLAVLFALYIFNSSFRKDDQLSKARFTVFLGLISLCFSVACSAIWEIFEYLGDIVFPVKMVKGGLEDTMSDLMVGAVTALITAIGYYFLRRVIVYEKE